MTMSVGRPAPPTTPSQVAEPTTGLWVPTALAAVVGTAAADLLVGALRLGPTGTLLVTSALLLMALGAQLTCRRHVPVVYWTAVTLVSMAATLLVGRLVDGLGIGLDVAAAGSSVALAAALTAPWAGARTVSAPTTATVRHEASSWLAVLVAFALGTAVADLLAGGLHLGPSSSVGVLVTTIAVVVLAHARFGLGAAVSYRTGYVLTCALGTSVGDLLSHDRTVGGLGVGPMTTGAGALLTLAAVVVRLPSRVRAA